MKKLIELARELVIDDTLDLTQTAKWELRKAIAAAELDTVAANTAPETQLAIEREFTSRELATVLHALRTIQTEGRIEGCAAGECDHFEDEEPLTNEEIDALCERINLQPTRKETRS